MATGTPLTAADTACADNCHTPQPLPAIYLASASPRRSELLRQLGIPFTLLINPVDESHLPQETAEQCALRLAAKKARSAVPHAPENRPVLAADTLVTLDGEIFGKPHNADHARTMLRRLSGRTHQVITAIALADRQHLRTQCIITAVTLRHLQESDISQYLACGEPLDKAGAYAIQGQGGRFVRHINGSYHAVVGLPLVESWELLNEFIALPTESHKT